MKILIVLLAAVLVASNLYWIGQTMDTGVDRLETRRDFATTSDSLDAAVMLANLNLVGLPAAEARLQIDRVWQGTPAVEHTDGCIYVESICLELNAAGDVADIRIVSEPATE